MTPSPHPHPPTHTHTMTGGAKNRGPGGRERRGKGGGGMGEAEQEKEELGDSLNETTETEARGPKGNLDLHHGEMTGAKSSPTNTGLLSFHCSYW